MKENHSLEMIGIQNTTGKVHYNLNPARLVEEALRRGEGVLTNTRLPGET